MSSAKAAWLLIAYCLTVQAAILPSELGPSAMIDAGTSALAARPQVVFKKYTRSGSSIWKTLFARNQPLTRCPSGYVLRNDQCFNSQYVCPKTFVFLNDQCVCPAGTFLQNGQCHYLTQKSPDSGFFFSSRAPKRLLQALNPIRLKIWPWYSTPIGGSLTNTTTPGQSQTVSEDPYQICKATAYNLAYPTEYLLNVDNSMENIFPGSFIQSKYLSTESLVSLPIGSDIRHPINVASTDGNSPTVEADPPTAGSVHQAIRQSILTSIGYSSATVYYDLTTSDSIEQLAKNFNFNAKILQQLDISGGFNGNWQTRKSKQIFTMVQKINTYYPDMFVRTPGELSDPIGVFLKPNFDITYADNLELLGYWGPNNPPLYVSEVYYGRMIVVSVDKNDYTQSTYTELQSSTSTDAQYISVAITKLFQDSSKKVFSIGPFSQVDFTQLASGSWQNFFAPIPSDSPTAQSLKPIGYRLRDWMMRSVKVSNFLQYNTIICQPKSPRTIVVRFPDYYKTIRIQLRRPGQAGFTIIGTSDMDITAFLANGDNQIWIQNVVVKPNILKPDQRRVKFQLFINGVSKFGPASKSCTRCHSTNVPGEPIAAFICKKVNKYTGDPECYAP